MVKMHTVKQVQRVRVHFANATTLRCAAFNPVWELKPIKTAFGGSRLTCDRIVSPLEHFGRILAAEELERRSHERQAEEEAVEQPEQSAELIKREHDHETEGIFANWAIGEIEEMTNLEEPDANPLCALLTQQQSDRTRFLTFHANIPGCSIRSMVELRPRECRGQSRHRDRLAACPTHMHNNACWLVVFAPRRDRNTKCPKLRISNKTTDL